MARIDPGQHWLMLWFVSPRQEAFTWTNVDLHISSKVFCGIKEAISQEVLMNVIRNVCSKLHFKIATLLHRARGFLKKPKLKKSNIFCLDSKHTEISSSYTKSRINNCSTPQIAKFMGPPWGPPGFCRPQMGPMLAPWTLLSGYLYHHQSQHMTDNEAPTRFSCIPGNDSTLLYSEILCHLQSFEFLILTHCRLWCPVTELSQQYYSTKGILVTLFVATNMIFICTITTRNICIVTQQSLGSSVSLATTVH